MRVTVAVDMYADYRRVLAEQTMLKPSEWTFKSDPAYRQILEHVSPQQGYEYLAQAQRSPRWSARMRTLVAETALANDRFGKPVQAQFDALGISCSPTNMRYLWHAFEILDWIEHLGLPALNIVELGGGYGGLALWLHRLAPEVLKSYAIVDLPEAVAIQMGYAVQHLLPVEFVDEGDDDLLGEIVEADSFLISAYGFSEFPIDVRRHYESHVVRHCEHGWLLWNLGPVYPFTDHVYEVYDEQPLTGQGNKVVRF